MTQQIGKTRQSEETSTREEPSPEAGGVDPPELTLDAILQVTKNQRRRRILRYLEPEDGPVAIGDIAEQLAQQEYDCPNGGPTSTQRKRMYVGIYQGHLPKLDQMGVIEFDKEGRTAELGLHGGRVVRFMNRATGDEQRWPVVYLAEASLAAVLLMASLYVPTATAVTTLALGVVVGLLVFTSAWHLYRWREESLAE